MKNTLLTVAFLAVGSLLFTPEPSLAVGICGCNNAAAGYCYQGPPGVPNPCAPEMGRRLRCYNPEGNRHCGAAGGFNPCLNKECGYASV